MWRAGGHRLGMASSHRLEPCPQGLLASIKGTRGMVRVARRPAASPQQPSCLPISSVSLDVKNHHATTPYLEATGPAESMNDETCAED